MVKKATSTPKSTTSYILITENLQNGFFLDSDSRLTLPISEALRVLVGSPLELQVRLDDPDNPKWFTAISQFFEKDDKQAWRDFLKMRYQEVRGHLPTPIKEEDYEAQISIENPPPSALPQPVTADLMDTQPTPIISDLLPAYVQQTVRTTNKRSLPEKLIQQGPLYQFLKTVIDDEGRGADLHVVHVRDWGAQLTPETWAAQPIEGFDALLQPYKNDTSAAAQAASDIGYRRGSVTFYDVRSESMFDFKAAEGETALLSRILDRLTADEGKHVQIVVIGTPTDVKIRLLLGELRSRYELDRLVVSDVLTAAPTLDRHLEGLKFASEVLDVEIVHNLNDLVAVLSSQPLTAVIPHTIAASSPRFEDFQQSGYQDTGMFEYVELSKRQSARVYKSMLTASNFMMVVGGLFVALALLASLLMVLDSDRATADYMTAMVIIGAGGLGLLALVFLGNPMRYLQNQLNQLVQMQTNLEARSLIDGLLRHYFSHPEHLSPQDPQREKAELDNLERQIDLIWKASAQMSERVSRFGLRRPKDED